jgi:hypothetical protein
MEELIPWSSVRDLSIATEETGYKINWSTQTAIKKYRVFIYCFFLFHTPGNGNNVRKSE